jgi:hypothetical protein
MGRFVRAANNQLVENCGSIRWTGAFVVPLLWWLCAASMAQAGTATATLTVQISAQILKTTFVTRISHSGGWIDRVNSRILVP